MSIIIVGDIHAKNKEPFKTTVIKFLTWLYTTFPDSVIIQCGDLFDSSSPHAEIEETVIGLLKKFKKVFIISGNHDYSKIHGNTLLPLIHHENLNIILAPTETVIDNCKFLFLPYKYGRMKEEYENLKGDYDFIITHTTPSFVAFGDEGIDYQLQGTFIHGHTHIVKAKFHNDGKNTHIFLEVPYPTRFGEHLIDKHSVIALRYDKETNNKCLEYKEIPFFFTYETIKFGDQPTDKNNIINVIDAPDSNSVYEMYKGFHIRDEGIELRRTDSEFGDIMAFDTATVKDTFGAYCRDNGIAKEIMTCGLKYLEGI
jgi:predicted phosphodiesterase